MLPDHIIITIVLIHFLGDFALQTHEQAINKSTDWSYMFNHVLNYSLVWLVMASILLGFDVKVLYFFFITFAAHFVTDAFTSPRVKYFFDNKDYHNGFTMIGFDQTLHFFQLYYTFKFLL